MQNQCHVTRMLASSVLAMLSLVACQQSQAPTPTPTAAESKAAVPPTQHVFVVFAGPWAFAPDPKDANSVLAISAKTRMHRDLYVQASSNASLAAGIYELSLPARAGSPAGTADPSIAQAKIDPKSLDLALGAKSARYVIRVPKPEAYEPATRTRSRVGPTYPPDASTEKDYATSVSLRYGVGSLTGFSLGGTPDSGTFNPLLLELGTPPMVRFVLDPAHDDDPVDQCDTQSRQSFRDLTKLLNLTLYVDFPDNPSGCHDKDPQKPSGAKAEGPSALERMAELLGGNLVDTQATSPASGVARASSVAHHLMMGAICFFARPMTNCKSPVIILTLGP